MSRGVATNRDSLARRVTMSPVQIADGTFKVDGLRIANVYLVATEEGLLLVDTGMPRNAKRILSLITSIGRKPSDLRDIVLTHCDIDHVGSVAELKRLTGARVAIHEIDAPVLSGEQRPQKGGLTMVALYRLLRFRPVAPDLRLRDRDTISGLQVRHVPGYTGGSIALVRDDGVVFSGDALLSDRDGHVLPPDPRLALDRAQARVSAEMITARHATLLLPGHGAPASAEWGCEQEASVYCRPARLALVMLSMKRGRDVKGSDMLDPGPTLPVGNLGFTDGWRRPRRPYNWTPYGGLPDLSRTAHSLRDFPSRRSRVRDPSPAPQIPGDHLTGQPQAPSGSHSASGPSGPTYEVVNKVEAPERRISHLPST